MTACCSLQFNKDALSQQLPAEFGIRYEWLGKELGGLRSRNKSSELNSGWDNAAFRGKQAIKVTDSHTLQSTLHPSFYSTSTSCSCSSQITKARVPLP